MKKFNPLDENNIPQPNTLLLCKRKAGGIYIAVRKDRPLSTNPDPSQNCDWNGDLIEDSFICSGNNGLTFQFSFSDITVDSWTYLLGQDLIALIE